MSDNKILSAEDLEKNFQPEYPAYTIAQWRETVASGHTIEGYWHWVHTMLTEEAGLEEDMGETGDNTAVPGIGFRTAGTCTPILRDLTSERTFRVIAEQLGWSESNIKLEQNLVDDLNADSLDQIVLVMAIEEEFEIEISDEDAEKIQTVSGVVDYVKRRLGEPC